MDELEYRVDGTVAPTGEYAAIFASDLRDTILHQLLGGMEHIREETRGKILTCRLPKEAQILDFVELRATDTEDEIEVTLTIPSNENEKMGYFVRFDYIPPR